MRTSMTFPIRFWAALLVFLLIFQYSTEAVSTDADSQGCNFKTDIELSLDVSETETACKD